MGDEHSAWRVGVRAAVLVGLARLLLTRCGPSEVLRRLAGEDARRGAALGIDEGQALTAVRRAGRVFRADCLPQAIALTALLHRGGGGPELILGCRRYGPNQWGAHAWVEIGGRTLDPVEQPDHAALARLSATKQWEVGPATN
jgi:hypothetical protein